MTDLESICKGKVKDPESDREAGTRIVYNTTVNAIRAIGTIITLEELGKIFPEAKYKRGLALRIIKATYFKLICAPLMSYTRPLRIIESKIVVLLMESIVLENIEYYAWENKFVETKYVDQSVNTSDNNDFIWRYFDLQELIKDYNVLISGALRKALDSRDRVEMITLVGRHLNSKIIETATLLKANAGTSDPLSTIKIYRFLFVLNIALSFGSALEYLTQLCATLKYGPCGPDTLPRHQSYRGTEDILTSIVVCNFKCTLFLTFCRFQL